MSLAPVSQLRGLTVKTVVKNSRRVSSNVRLGLDFGIVGHIVVTFIVNKAGLRIKNHRLGHIWEHHAGGV